MKFLVAILLLICLCSCKVGDGKVDALESIGIRTSTVALLEAKPQLTYPTFVVSEALLNKFSNDESVNEDIDKIIEDKLDNMVIDDLHKALFWDLVLDVRSQIKEKISSIPDTEKRKIVVKDILIIINDVARRKMGTEK